MHFIIQDLAASVFLRHGRLWVAAGHSREHSAGEMFSFEDGRISLFNWRVARRRLDENRHDEEPEYAPISLLSYNVILYLIFSYSLSQKGTQGNIVELHDSEEGI